jgi:hypothetical protein
VPKKPALMSMDGMPCYAERQADRSRGSTTVRWVIGALNLLCVPIMLMGPLLVPITSSMTPIERATLPMSITWLWGPGLGFWLSFVLHRQSFTIRELRRRALFLDYYPIWSVGSLVLFFLLWPRLALLGIG